jgi:DNA-directed RNA polymerase subunit RPC12/RpoP
LPSATAATSDATHRLENRVQHLERLLDQQKKGGAGAPLKPSDTLNLRASLVLWASLGTLSGVRWRLGLTIPAAWGVCFAVAGGGVTLYLLVHALVEALQRFLGFGPPKVINWQSLDLWAATARPSGLACLLTHRPTDRDSRPQIRCYRCMTIFEVQGGTEAACPECGARNAIPAKAKSAFG